MIFKKSVDYQCQADISSGNHECLYHYVIVVETFQFVPGLTDETETHKSSVCFLSGPWKP